MQGKRTSVQIRALNGVGSERGAERAKYSRSVERVFIKWPEWLLLAAPVPSHHESRACTNPPRIHLCLQQLTKRLANTSKIVCCVMQQTRYTYAMQCVPGWIAPSLKFERAWSDFYGVEFFWWVGSRTECFGVSLSGWAGRSEHLCERGAEILIAQLRSHALVQIHHVRDIGFRKIV